MLEIPNDAPAELHCWKDEPVSDQPMRTDVVVAKGPFAILAGGLISIDPDGSEGDWSIIVEQRRLTHQEISEWLRQKSSPGRAAPIVQPRH